MEVEERNPSTSTFNLNLSVLRDLQRPPGDDAGAAEVVRALDLVHADHLVLQQETGIPGHRDEVVVRDVVLAPDILENLHDAVDELLWLALLLALPMFLGNRLGERIRLLQSDLLDLIEAAVAGRLRGAPDDKDRECPNPS